MGVVDWVTCFLVSCRVPWAWTSSPPTGFSIMSDWAGASSWLPTGLRMLLAAARTCCLSAPRWASSSCSTLGGGSGLSVGQRRSSRAKQRGPRSTVEELAADERVNETNLVNAQRAVQSFQYFWSSSVEEQRPPDGGRSSVGVPKRCWPGGSNAPSAGLGTVFAVAVVASFIWGLLQTSGRIRPRPLLDLDPDVSASGPAGRRLPSAEQDESARASACSCPGWSRWHCNGVDLIDEHIPLPGTPPRCPCSPTAAVIFAADLQPEQPAMADALSAGPADRRRLLRAVPLALGADSASALRRGSRHGLGGQVRTAGPGSLRLGQHDVPGGTHWRLSLAEGSPPAGLRHGTWSWRSCSRPAWSSTSRPTTRSLRPRERSPGDIHGGPAPEPATWTAR